MNNVIWNRPSVVWPLIYYNLLCPHAYVGNEIVFCQELVVYVIPLHLKAYDHTKSNFNSLWHSLHEFQGSSQFHGHGLWSV